MKNSSLDTVSESSADPVPLRESVEGLHYSKIQTSELPEQLFSWSLISGIVGSIFDLSIGFEGPPKKQNLKKRDLETRNTKT